MQILNTLQPDYTAYRGYYQLKLPLEMETMIPADDPVRLLSAFVEGMDLSELYDTYGRIRKNQASPRQMFKIMVYAAMNGIFSSRDIETACRREINFMFLLEGMPAPDHATIARFISLHLSACPKEILADVTSSLLSLGEISAKTVFIDDTPANIETAINIGWHGIVYKDYEQVEKELKDLQLRQRMNFLSLL